ncbi:MAG: hypothetical protein V1835_04575, partial [Candidatus Micrarchaeota archaeon]
VCALIEDQVDYDWNDINYSSRITYFANNSMLMEVRNIGCDTAARDALFVEFNFSSPKYVVSLNDGIARNGTKMKFRAWSDCHLPPTQTRRFTIQDDNSGNPPVNLPPFWEPMKNPEAFHTGSWEFVRYEDFAWDETDTSLLIYSISSVSNASVLSCVTITNPPNEGRFVRCTGLANGSTTVTMQAQDAAGLSSTASFNASVGLMVNLPVLYTLPLGFTMDLNLTQLAYDPVWPSAALNFTLTRNTLPGVASCSIVSNNSFPFLRCIGTFASVNPTSVRIRVENPDHVLNSYNDMSIRVV